MVTDRLHGCIMAVLLHLPRGTSLVNSSFIPLSESNLPTQSKMLPILKVYASILEFG